MRHPWIVGIALALTAGAAQGQEYDAQSPLVWPAKDPYLDRVVAESPVAALVELSAIHGFVRDSISTEIYDGVLRGPRGTLVLGAGNSLDKSLLLAELAARTGKRVRIAQGELSDDAAMQVVSMMQSDLGRRAAELAAGVATDLRSAPGVGEADDDERQDLEYVVSLKAGLLKRIGGLWADLRGFASLGAMHTAESARSNERRQVERLRRKAKSHFWVQVESSPEGAWLDLDPVLPQPSGRPATAVTHRYESGQVPGSFRHAIEFEVQSTFQQDGERRTRTNLKVRSFADQLGHLPLVLVHPGKSDPFGALVSFDVLPSGAVGGLPFSPVLFLGTRPYRGVPLTMNGWSEANAFFGGTKPEIVDETIRVRVFPPGSEPIEHARWILNRASTKERAKAGGWSLDPITETRDARIADAGESVRVDLMPLPLRSLWAFRIGIGPGDAGQVDAPLVRSEDAAEVGDPETVLALGSILESAAFVDVATRVSVGGGGYFPVSVRPTVSAMMVGARAEDSNKVDLEATAVIGMDLMDAFSLPLDGKDPQGHGLFGLAVEQAFVEMLVGRRDDASDSLFTARNILSAAARAGIPFIVVRGPQDLPKLSEAVGAVVKTHRMDGILVVPRDLVKFHGATELAWLRMDAESFYAEDDTSLDAGAALVEYIKKNEKVIKQTESVCRFRQCLAMAQSIASKGVAILRGKIEMRAIVDVATAYQDASDCSKVRLTIPVYKVWKKGMGRAERDVRNKLEAMQQAARSGQLKIPSKRTYQKQREQSPGEFATERERQLGRKKRDDEDWDHRVELGCGGKHEATNVFPLDSSYNSSLGNFLGRACRALCEGTIISDIRLKFILPGGPGASLPFGIVARLGPGWHFPEASCNGEQ
jgi:hypothetical protein